MDERIKTSIEIAEDLIKENERQLEFSRSDILSYTTSINSTRETIESLETRLRELEDEMTQLKYQIDIANDEIKHFEELILDAKNEKREYLVDTLALRMFIASGGGLDMLDES